MDPSYAAMGRGIGGDDIQRGGPMSKVSADPANGHQALGQQGLSQLDFINMAAANGGLLPDVSSYAYGRRSQSAEDGLDNGNNGNFSAPSPLAYEGVSRTFPDMHAGQGGLCSSPGTGGALGFSAADLALASQIGLPTSSSAAGALSAAAAASRGAFGEGPRIYVGGVPDLVTVAMVRDHFSRWGVVRDVHFPKERTSRRRRHFCFVTFESLQAAERAVAESNREIGGYPVAAINIPTDRLTHYGLRQGGLAPAPVLRGGSVYGSPGAAVRAPDVTGSPGRSVTLPGPYAVTHQIGSQRLLGTQSADFMQQPDIGAQMAAASEQEVAAALAALRLGASPSQALSALGSNAGSGFFTSGPAAVDERSSGPGLHTGLVTRSAGYGSGIPPLGEERSPGEAAPHLTTLNPAMQRQMTGSSSSSLSGQGAPGRAASLEYGAGQESAAAAHPSADSPYASRLAPLSVSDGSGNSDADTYMALLSKFQQSNAAGASINLQPTSQMANAALQQQLGGSGQSMLHNGAGGVAFPPNLDSAPLSGCSVNGAPGLAGHPGRSISLEGGSTAQPWSWAPSQQLPPQVLQQHQVSNLRSNSAEANSGRSHSPAGMHPCDLRASSLNPNLLCGMGGDVRSLWQQRPPASPAPHTFPPRRASTSGMTSDGAQGGVGGGDASGDGTSGALAALHFTPLPQDYLAKAPAKRLEPIAGSVAGSNEASGGEVPHPADSGGSGLEALERNMTDLMRSNSEGPHPEAGATARLGPLPAGLHHK